MKIKNLILICLLMAGLKTLAQKKYVWKTSSSGGYTFKYVANDPTKSRFYQMKNGLTIVLSQNDKEPIIQCRIAVRSGSNNDPRHATGLAHYLEHMLFKGTDKFGTVDYAREKPLLAQIDSLYELYGKTTDPGKRKEIYTKIDKTSGLASQYSIANEYDKIMKEIGGQTTNAHTWFEETVYKEDFPANATDQFLALQAERFRSPVFRLFHTELEAVYEEKNRALDDDYGKLNEKVLEVLFPTHNYGQQTTLGTIAHLKNPSLAEIRKFYNQHYVPNNMIVAMAGDFNPDEMVKKIDKSFAYMQAKPLTVYNPGPERPLTNIQTLKVFGPSQEGVSLWYRGFPNGSKQSVMLKLISGMLSNEKAGLFDINLNQKQKLLKANAGYMQMKDYGIFQLFASPKEGQTLDQASKLLVDQIDLLKSGTFDSNLISAVIANEKLRRLHAYGSSVQRVESVTTEFILSKGTNWNQSLAELDLMASFTRAQIMNFAKSFFQNNYVIAYKCTGTDPDVIKVEKPTITPVTTNPAMISAFTQNLFANPTKSIAPKFLDYNKDIVFGKSGIADVITVQNKENGFFSLSYRFDLGTWNDKLQPFAAQYLAFLGTDKYSAEDISKQFYNIACSYNLNVGNELVTLNISGLQENFNHAVALVEHLFTNCKANEPALDAMKADILKERENNKANKSLIMDGLTAYARYGADNPFNYSLTDKEVMNITSRQLLDIIHNYRKYPHVITYFGPENLSEFTSSISKLHTLPKEFTAVPPAKKFAIATQTGNQIYFTDYDMVQAEVHWVRNGEIYNPENAAKITLLNNYFGGGMGSIVFQTIRESKALAYATYAYYAVPDSRRKNYSMVAYVGTQSDKIKDAMTGMNELLNDIPYVQKSLENSKSNALNAIATDRITNERIIPRYFADKKLGFLEDSRINEYETLQRMNFEDIKSFHSKHIANKPYTYCILAAQSRISIGELEKIGPVRKLSLKEIFGY